MSFTIELEIHLQGETSRQAKAILGLDSQVVTRIMDSWSRTYLLFIRKRFIAAARGNGTWRPLAPATVQARRRKRRGRVLILRDTDLMFENVTPEFTQVYMGVQNKPKFSATIKPGENAQYPDGKSVREVMLYHQLGGPNLPQRKVIVPPDAATENKMAYDAKKIIRGK